MDRRWGTSWRPVSVALAALIIVSATVAVAGAKDDKVKPDTDEVTNSLVTSTANGVVTGPGENDEDAVFANIPLSQSTFTQKAGEVLVISAKTEMTYVSGNQETAHCDVHVGLTGLSDTPGWDFLVEEMHLLARRGDPGLSIDHGAVPAPPTDKTYTLEAAVWSEKVPGNDFGGTTEAQDCSDETVSAALRISFTSLRD